MSQQAVPGAAFRSTASASAHRPVAALTAHPYRTGLVAVVGLYVLVCLIWGTTWIAIKYSVDDLPPTVAAGARFLVAAPLLVTLCLVKRVPLRFPRELRWFAFFVTAGYFCIPYLLLNVGETYVSSGLTAICFATVSILILVMSGPVLGVWPTPGQLVGVSVAFLALAALVGRSGHVTSSSAWGVVAVLAAAVMHSFAYVMIKRHGAEVHVLTLNTLPMAIAGVGLSCVGLLRAGPGAIDVTPQAVWSTLYLGVVASVICFLAYFSLLKRLSALTMSFVFVIFPVVAFIISATVEGDRFEAVDLALTLAVVGAFAVTHLVGHRSARTAPSPPGDDESALSDEHLAAVYAAAVEAYPHEACGYVRRSGVVVCENQVEVLRASGAVESDRTVATGYAFGTLDLLRLAAAVDDDVDPVLVIFHSHPDVGAYFSDEDQRHAVIDGIPAYPVDHLVVDAREGRAAGARRFTFSATTGAYEPAAVHGDPSPADGLAPRRGR